MTDFAPSFILFVLLLFGEVDLPTNAKLGYVKYAEICTEAAADLQ